MAEDGATTVEELKSTGHDSRKDHHLSAVNIMMETGKQFMPAVVERVVAVKYPPINFSVLQKSTKQTKNYYGQFQKIIDNVIKMRRSLLLSPAQRTARSMKIQTDFSNDNSSVKGTSKMVVTMNMTGAKPEVHHQQLPRVPIFSENRKQLRESPKMINFSQVVKFVEDPSRQTTV